MISEAPLCKSQSSFCTHLFSTCGHIYNVCVSYFAGQIMDRTPTDLLQLKRCVAFRIADRWHDIGIQLKFEVAELDQIDKNYQPPHVEECCKATLYLWKRRTTRIRAIKLIKAIEEAGNVAYASKLRQGT